MLRQSLVNYGRNTVGASETVRLPSRLAPGRRSSFLRGGGRRPGGGSAVGNPSEPVQQISVHFNTRSLVLVLTNAQTHHDRSMWVR